KIGKPTCSTNCLLRSCVAPMKGRSLACSSRSVLSLRRGSNGANALREAAAAYKVDTDAITLKVKQEVAPRRKRKRRPNQCLQAGPRAAKQPGSLGEPRGSPRYCTSRLSAVHFA